MAKIRPPRLFRDKKGRRYFLYNGVKFYDKTNKPDAEVLARVVKNRIVINNILAKRHGKRPLRKDLPKNNPVINKDIDNQASDAIRKERAELDRKALLLSTQIKSLTGPTAGARRIAGPGNLLLLDETGAELFEMPKKYAASIVQKADKLSFKERQLQQVKHEKSRALKEQTISYEAKSVWTSSGTTWLKIARNCW